MKQQRWMNLIFFASLLSVFSLGCSKQTPEPTKSSDAPAAEAQMDATPQADQEVPAAPNATIPTEDKKAKLIGGLGGAAVGAIIYAIIAIISSL
jgi:hypothetical protein